MKNPYAVFAIAGGFLWLVLNLALVGAWERGDNFPTYEFLNALRPLPLVLLAYALYGLHRALNVGRRAVLISLSGFFLLAAGAAIEFWIGGGVRDRDVDTISLAGWLTYLAGYLLLSIGLIAFGVAVYRPRAWGAYSTVPLVTGIVWASWFPSIMLDNLMQNSLADISQYLFAILWIVIGALLWKENRPRQAVV